MWRPCGCCWRPEADVNAATRDGITPLPWPPINGSVGDDRHAARRPAPKPNVALPEGETILMTAARTGQPEVVKLLLDAGADLNAREHWFGETALMWAAAENHAEAVRVLVEAGADVNARSKLLDVPRRRDRPVGAAAREAGRR